MNPHTLQTPGVYIQESEAFSNSVPGVATAVPAFIGYTPKASYQGKSYTNIPVKITSFADFMIYFCRPAQPLPADPPKQYFPQYYLIQQNNEAATGDTIMIAGKRYSIIPDPATLYYLYNSVQLFYENGGGDAYIVSVGTYGLPSGKPLTPGTQAVNPNVRLTELMAGLTALRNEQEPTLYLCPEATLLPPQDNAILMQGMLSQATEMQTAVCLFDVTGGNAPDPVLYPQDIAAFRLNTGNNGLSYGIAYYPFLCTSVMQVTDIDYTHLFGGDTSRLEPVINPADRNDAAVTAIFNEIRNPGSGQSVARNHNTLMNASPLYSQVINAVLSAANILPPSGAMAGVITTIDNTDGPWQAPANVSIKGVTGLPISLSDRQQELLNIDPVSGKSINVIRNFNGRGILVWGARTLDGNSLDFRYIPVRRTLIFLEQSCKLAVRAFVFQPNTNATWVAVKMMISSFLTSIWKQGGLCGASPGEAFSVDCGLGTTMTGEDILDGYMNISIRVALIRPAEFIMLTFRQQMPAAG